MSKIPYGFFRTLISNEFGLGDFRDFIYYGSGNTIAIDKWSDSFKATLAKSGHLPFGYTYKAHTVLDKSWNGMLPIKVESSYDEFCFGLVDVNKSFFPCPILIGFVQLFELDTRSPAIVVWNKDYSFSTEIDLSPFFSENSRLAHNPIPTMQILCSIINGLNHCVSLKGGLSNNIGERINRFPFKRENFTNVIHYINSLKFKFYGYDSQSKNRDGDLIEKNYCLLVIERIDNDIYLANLLKSAVTTFFKSFLREGDAVVNWQGKLCVWMNGVHQFEGSTEGTPIQLAGLSYPPSNLMMYRRKIVLKNGWLDRDMEKLLTLSIASKYSYPNHCAFVLG